MSTALEKISGMGGFGVVISDTNAHTGLLVESLVINSDAVFTELKIGGTSVIASRGLSGVTIKAGVYLPTDPGVKITDVTLASGSIIPYL